MKLQKYKLSAFAIFLATLSYAIVASENLPLPIDLPVDLKNKVSVASVATLREQTHAIIERGNRSFDPQNNEIDRLRKLQMHQHLRDAEVFQAAGMLAESERELRYAESLIDLPLVQEGVGVI